MMAAALITLFASAGVTAGVCSGLSRRWSRWLMAIGGGLLVGTALFWLLPEMIATSGWARSLTIAALAALGLVVVDGLVQRTSATHRHAHDPAAGRSPLEGFIWPLLTASAVHSFVDGWSAAYITTQSALRWAVPAGLALHKLPEGFALGLIARKSIGSTGRTLVACVAAESLTLLGAFAEPQLNQTALERFGPAWTTVVLGTIAGSFFYLGLHAVQDGVRRYNLWPVFLLAAASVGVAARLHGRLPGM